MNTETTFQPFAADGSHFAFGRALMDKLLAGDFDQLKIAVAFATASGPSRLFGPLQTYIASGGTGEAYVGIRNGITSAQAVDILLQAGLKVFGCDTQGAVLFHPKVYLFAGRDSAWISTGSSNLTREGLFRNYECNTIVDLDRSLAVDEKLLRTSLQWFAAIPRIVASSDEITARMIPGLVADGLLIDESVVAPRTTSVLPQTSGSRRPTRSRPVIPAAPPPHPAVAPVRRTTAAPTRAQVPAATPAPMPAQPPRFFAMTLADFDASHRRGTPGTPEVSVPDSVVSFFPPTALSGRQYPDAYFEVLLNRQNGTTSTVEFRLWQRPPGSNVGHADWRINVKHDTIDETRVGGGDILLFERLPDGSAPAYEVWVVQPGDPSFAALQARLTQQVQASGRAGTKHYAIF